jgi:hypothetical protein
MIKIMTFLFLLIHLMSRIGKISMYLFFFNFSFNGEFFCNFDIIMKYFLSPHFKLNLHDKHNVIIFKSPK